MASSPGFIVLSLLLQQFTRGHDQLLQRQEPDDPQSIAQPLHLHHLTSGANNTTARLLFT